MIRTVYKADVFIHFGVTVDEIINEHPQVDELLKKILLDAHSSGLVILLQLGWVGVIENEVYTIVVCKYQRDLRTFCTSIYKGKDELAVGYFHIDLAAITFSYLQEVMLPHEVIFYHVAVLAEICLKANVPTVELGSLLKSTQHEANIKAFGELGKLYQQNGVDMWDMKAARPQKKSTN